MIRIIDTHCHIDNEQFTEDREQVLDKCKQLGIKRIIVPGVTRSGWDNLLTLCQTHDELSPALGLHPMFISEHSPSDINDLDYYLKTHDLVAIGEIGLDYYDKMLNKEIQLDYFEQQLALAEKYKLPVILHVRKSHEAVINTLRKYKLVGGTVHAFSGSKEQAELYIKLGFKLGFGGVLTYPAAKKVRKVASEIPLTSIVLETDAPDMVVLKHKGERNSPEYIIDSLSALAEIRNQHVDEIAQVTTNNAEELFSTQV